MKDILQKDIHGITMKSEEKCNLLILKFIVKLVIQEVETFGVEVPKIDIN